LMSILVLTGADANAAHAQTAASIRPVEASPKIDARGIPHVASATPPAPVDVRAVAPPGSIVASPAAQSEQSSSANENQYAQPSSDAGARTPRKLSVSE
jgi:hypothetical protein